MTNNKGKNINLKKNSCTNSYTNTSSNLIISQTSSSSSFPKNYLLNKSNILQASTEMTQRKLKKSTDVKAKNILPYEEDYKTTVTNTQSSKQKQTSISHHSIGNITNKKLEAVPGIDTPEELHFFYIDVIQNGKKVSSKF